MESTLTRVSTAVYSICKVMVILLTVEISLVITANIFGRLSAAITPDRSAIMVPKDAVQWEGCCNIVFVQEAQNRYRPHKVAISRGDNNHYAVVSGLQSGDMDTCQTPRW